MKPYSHPTPQQFNLSCILHALSDPVRLDYLRQLADCNGEVACGTIVTPVAKSTLSHHLRVLREAGLVKIRCEGTQSLTTLRYKEVEARFPGVLKSVLKSAQSEGRKV
jgi:DNA-binding transcriptional ArsR family regulator